MYCKTKTILVILSTGVPALALGSETASYTLDVPVEENPSVLNSTQSQQAVTSEIKDESSPTEQNPVETSDSRKKKGEAVVAGVAGFLGAGLGWEAANQLHEMAREQGHTKVVKLLNTAKDADGKLDATKLKGLSELSAADVLKKVGASRFIPGVPGDGIVKKVPGFLRKAGAIDNLKGEKRLLMRPIIL